MKSKVFNLEQFNPNINYVIEASAGTGKTYNIVEIVKKLVLENNVDLNKILIVTFTEKAAGELKNRIRDQLKCNNIEKASIYTIHSFCQNAIKEFGLSANLPLNLSVVDESEMLDFGERYIREGKVLEDLSLFTKAGIPFNKDNLIKKLVKTTTKYYLDKDYQEDEQVISFRASKEMVDTLDIKLTCYFAKSIDDVLVKFPDIDLYYKILAECDAPLAKQLANLLETEYKNNFNFPSKVYSLTTFKKLAKEYNSPNLPVAVGFFNDLSKLLNDLKVEKIISSFYLKDFYEKYQKEKELNKQQTFDDMIRYVRESIKHSNALKIKLQNKYSYAIIDEFQDTNQRQFDIFKNIFMNDDEHHIIVVGDPKQSIYSFQGADIDVYYQAVNEILASGGEICKLNTNYRSTESMVKNCNKLFNYYNFSGTTFEDCGYLSKESKEYHDVLYCGKETHAFWVVEGKDTLEINEDDFAKIAVQQIIDCCTKDQFGHTKLQVKSKGELTYRNVSFKDFAVLARSKSEMRNIEKALKSAGIPYLRYKDQQLFNGKECASWIALLQAISTQDFTGRNRKLLKKALFTQFFGLSLQTINSDYVSRDDIDEVIQIRQWQDLARNNNWKELFDEIIISSNLNKKMNSLKDIQSLSIYKQIARFCIEYLSRGKSIDDLIRTLGNLSLGGDVDSDDLNGSIIEKSTNFDCVQIMTIHASKGLQFPVVIAVCGFKSRKQNQDVYQVHLTDDFGKTKKVLMYDKQPQVNDEEIAELKRLYYVAYTRPQFILMLPFYQKFGEKFLTNSFLEYITNNKDEYRIIQDNGESFSNLRKESRKILEPTKNVEISDNQSDQTVNIKKLIKTSNSKKINKHSYSSLSHSLVEVIDVDEEDKEGIIENGLSMFDKLSLTTNGNYDPNQSPLTFPIDYPKGPKLGTALHEIFEGLDFKNSFDNLINKIHRCFKKQGINPKDEWITTTKQMVNEVLNASLPVIHGSNKTTDYIKLNEISLNNKLDEVEFNFNLLMTKLKNYCNGFVDLIFKHGDYYSIVDWKSDRLNEEFISYSDPVSLKNHVDECYSIQRVLYSYCLIKWLQQSMPNLSLEEIFNNHFGGVYYIFLRGCNQNTSNGVYCQTWKSWDDLENSFREIVKYKVGGIKHD